LILLDTNVLSELMRPIIDPAVNNWINRLTGNDLFISSITRAEIERGLNLLPAGRKRNVYRTCADQTFLQFKGRCLPFEESAAIRFGTVHAMRQRAGRPISTEDAQIASIALVHGMSIATRNIKDFKYIDGLDKINPWDFHE
jgi:predicted nucleic acid-binding protein